jgi:hypothetical protein
MTQQSAQMTAFPRSLHWTLPQFIVIKIIFQVPAGCLLVDKQKPGDIGQTLALVGKQYNFHAITNFPVTLHLMCKLECRSLADIVKFLYTRILTFGVGKFFSNF